MDKKSWFLSSDVWLRMGNVLGTPQRLFFVLVNSYFLDIGNWKQAIGISFRDFKCVGLWGLILEWVWFRSTLSKCIWSHCQISTAKIKQHLTLFSWRKSSSASPQMHYSMQNIILTKLSTWEYGNREFPFSWWKFGKVSRLVRYGALVGFRICVYGAHWHARTLTSRNLSKH